MVKEFPYLDNIISDDGEVNSGVMSRSGTASQVLWLSEETLERVWDAC